LWGIAKQILRRLSSYVEKVSMADILTIFREVRDPRDPNARHDLADILFVAVAGVLCGAKTCVDMAEFAEDRLETLREIVPLKAGAPSHDTFSRVFRLLDPTELARAFEACLAAIREELGSPSPKGVVAIDAKSLRRGYDKGRAFMPPLMVNVFDTQTRLSIAQARAPEGSEVKGTLALLKGLTLKGCTVTADALHCHAAMTKAVRGAKAHYALSLKGNQSALLADAEAAFAAAGEALNLYETRETRHGRKERRLAAILPASRLRRDPGFTDLAAIGRIEAERTGTDGKTDTQVRYVVLSRALAPRKLMELVRAHWAIENQLHWSLDVVFDEDDARSRKNYAPENLAVIRRLALNLLRSHPLQRSISGKMNRAAGRKDFLFELFAQMR
jgi:predicted transposase YbfD/YdcC